MPTWSRRAATRRSATGSTRSSAAWQHELDGAANTDLIPPALLIAPFFAAEQAAIDALEAEREALARQIEEAEEEQSGEDSLFAEARNERGKLTAKCIKDRRKAIRSDPEANEQRTALQAEVERVSQTLTDRVRELAERYAMPLPVLAAEVETLSARVEEHLRRMGVAWE